MPNKSLPEVSDGVVPVKDKAFELADKVKSPEAVIVPTPVIALELNSNPVDEKLYSSVPLTAILKVLPVKTFNDKSPELSRYKPTSVPAGAPVVSLKRRFDRSFKSNPSASISEVQGVCDPTPVSSTPQARFPEESVSKA